ncbi:MAG: DUF6702 family protein [Reichenbachiella sp.]|uniref:DUF6702 family protein n=1 Tax=Reichenbachiella sp. TaxID=2184521 RepID=UPI003263E8BE
MICSSAFSHEFNFGFFEIYEKQNSYYLQIRLDRSNVIQAINAKDNSSDIGQFQCELNEYLDQNLNFTINSQQVSLDYLDLSTNEDMIIIIAKIDLPYQPVVEIEVKNTVLLSVVKYQTNIIRMSLYQKNRSFRLNADRISTTIKY